MGRVRRKAVWGAALALAILLPSASAAAAEKSGKLDNELQQASSGSRRAVIVRVRKGTRERVRDRYHRGGGSRDLGFIDAVTTEVKGKELAELASDPDVLSISVDADVTATGYPSSASGAPAGVNPSAGTTASVLKRSLGIQDWFSGSSVTVAVIDSGIQNISDFDGRIIASYDFTNNDPRAVKAVDEYGHGTHIAGLIGSSGASSDGKYAGIAPGVRLVSLKVLKKNGSGKTSDVIRALEFAVANKDRFNIQVVNLSLGHPIYEPAATDPLVEAVERAVRAGLIVVTAAGNFGTNPSTGQQGYAGIASPGNAPSAITVGASNSGGTTGRGDDRVAPYSSRGPSWYDGIAKPDVVAPGANLLSNDVYGSTLSDTYPNLVVRDKAARLLRLNGTSMAAGVVTGLVAAMLDANNYGGYLRWQEYAGRRTYTGAPALTANAVKAMLQYSATPLRDANGKKYDALTQGSGEVNGFGALALAGAANTAARSGAFWMSVSWPAVTSFGGVDEQWSQSVIWGTRRLGGSSLVDLNQPAWASNIVWGTGQIGKVVVRGTMAGNDDNIVWGTLFDDNIVWGTLFGGNASFGDNIVWGTSMAWDDNIVWGTNLLGVVRGNNIVWGTMFEAGDNIVWGTLFDDNIVWGTSFDDNIVWGTANNVLGLVSSIGGGR